MKYSVRQLFRETPADQAEVTVSGWVRTVRDSKAFAFIALNDGTFFKPVQIVCEQNLSNFAEVVKTTLGSAIEVTGLLVLTPGAQQPFEIKAQKVAVIGPCDPSYPMQKKRHTVEYLRTQAHLRPAPTCSAPSSASVPSPPSPSTPSSRSGILFTCIPPSSPPQTPRARAKCSG